MFYYADLGPMGWRVVKREEAQFNVNKELVTSARETTVFASLYSQHVADYRAYQLNIGAVKE